MLTYTVRRLLIMIPTLLVISFVTFTIIKLPPGDFLSNQIAELRSQGDKAALERAEFMRAHGFETPYTQAPELCIEVVSPSNSVKELGEKTEAYLAAGADEVWIVYPQSKRCEFHGKQGPIASSRYAVDLADLFI